MIYHQQGKIDKAESCLKEAANQGHPQAMTSLGCLYKESDPTKSKMYYKMAAALGDNDAVEILKKWQD